MDLYTNFGGRLLYPRQWMAGPGPQQWLGTQFFLLFHPFLCTLAFSLSVSARVVHLEQCVCVRSVQDSGGGPALVEETKTFVGLIGNIHFYILYRRLGEVSPPGNLFRFVLFVRACVRACLRARGLVA